VQTKPPPDVISFWLCQPDVVPPEYLQPRRPSWCGTVEWNTPGVVPHLVVNLKDGDRTITGTELMTWLLHMAAHGVPGGHSRGADGRYHSVAFSNAAASLGLNAQRGLATREPGEPTKYVLGYSHITLDDPEPWRTLINRFDRVLPVWEEALAQQPGGGLTRRSDRGPTSLVCKCTPTTLPPRAGSGERQKWPRRIRVSGGIASDGGIRCDYCGELFEEQEAPRRRTASSGQPKVWPPWIAS
jgi:hypothetical protein